MLDDFGSSFEGEHTNRRNADEDNLLWLTGGLRGKKDALSVHDNPHQANGRRQ